MFKIKDLVWVRTQSYPMWPCIITKNIFKKQDDNYYYDVRFLGEKSTATIIVEDVLEFDITRPEFTPGKDVLRKYRTLSKALAEAENRVSSQDNKNSRPIPKQKEKPLDMLDSKEKELPPNKQSSFFQQESSKRMVVQKSISNIYPPQCEQLEQPNDSMLQLYNNNIKVKFLDIPEIKRPFYQDPPKQSESQPCVISSKIYHQIELSMERKKTNPLLHEANKVPLLAFKYSLPEKPQKKGVNQEKQTENKEYQIQSFSKIMSNYMTISTLGLTEYVKAIKWKTECIAFISMDLSLNTQPLKTKLQELISSFQIGKITFKNMIDSKISSLLSFIYKKLENISELSEQREWVSETIKVLNKKMVRQLNDCEFLEKVQQQKSKFLKSALVKKEKQYTIQMNQTKLEHLLNEGIKTISTSERQFLINEIVSNITQHNEKEIIEFLERRLKGKRYDQQDQFFEDFKEFINSF